MIQKFLDEFCKENNKEKMNLNHEALEVMLRYSWPGNVRELENIIEHAFVLCPGGLIKPEHLPENLVRPDTRGH